MHLTAFVRRLTLAHRRKGRVGRCPQERAAVALRCAQPVHLREKRLHLSPKHTTQKRRTAVRLPPSGHPRLATRRLGAREGGGGGGLIEAVGRGAQEQHDLLAARAQRPLAQRAPDAVIVRQAERAHGVEAVRLYECERRGVGVVTARAVDDHQLESGVCAWCAVAPSLQASHNGIASRRDPLRLAADLNEG